MSYSFWSIGFSFSWLNLFLWILLFLILLGVFFAKLGNLFKEKTIRKEGDFNWVTYRQTDIFWKTLGGAKFLIMSNVGYSISLFRRNKILAENTKFSL